MRDLALEKKGGGAVFALSQSLEQASKSVNVLIIIIIIIGALGSVSKKLAGHWEQLGIKNRTRTMQKSALLGSAHILRKVLEV